jgi:hypothetical protein
MIETIKHLLTNDHKQFLLSFKNGEPRWELLKYSHAQKLPAVCWKIQNIQGLTEERRNEALARLKKALDKELE